MLKKKLICIDYQIKNLLLEFFRRLLFRKIRHRNAVLRILIFRTGSLGDSLCALPAIDTIVRSFPNAQTDLLTTTGGARRVSLTDLIDPDKYRKAFNYSGTPLRQLLVSLRHEHYDLFVELPQADAPLRRMLRNMLFARLAGVRHGLGWRIGITFLFSRYQEAHFRFPDETSRLLRILAHAGLKVDSPRYIISQAESVSVREIQTQASPDTEIAPPMIAIAPGAKLPRNIWPAANYAQVASYFVGQGYRIMLIGGPEDMDTGRMIASGNPGITLLCGSMSPLESINLLKQCKLLICNDSGPMHMASVAGTPIVALFTAREYKGKWWPPESVPHKVLRTDNMPCAVCFRRGKNIPCAANVCLSRIECETVIKAAGELLEKPESEKKTLVTEVSRCVAPAINSQHT